MDPLKFQVAIQDEATGRLNQIEQEFDKLKDKTISVKVEGLSDLQQLLSALQHQQVSNLGKDVGNAINDATRNLQKEAQDAVRVSLGNLAQDLVAIKTAIQNDNFTAFSNRIQKCAEAVDTLDAAFKKFHVTIGSDDGMRNFMTGLGEVIRNVRTTMGTLEAGKNGTLGTIANTYARNVERMEDALFRIQEARAKVGNAINNASDAGMDAGVINRWRIYLQVLDAYEKKLQNIKRDDEMMHGNGWQTQTFGTSFKHLLSNANDFERYSSQFISEIQRRQQIAATTAENLGKHLDKLTAQKVDFRGLDTTVFDNAIAKIRAIQDELKSFARTGSSQYGTTANEIVRSMNLADANKAAANAQKELRKEISDTANAERRFKSEQEAGYNAVATKIADVQIKIDKYKQALAGAVNTSVSTSALDAQKQKVEELAKLLEQIRNNNGVTDDGRTMKSVMREYGQYIKQADYAMSNLNKQVAEHNRNAKKDPAVEAQKEYASLVKQIAQMQKTEVKASNLGIDTTELRRKIELLERYRQDLERLVNMKGNNNGFTIFDFRDTAYNNARANGSVERQRAEAAYQTEKANRAAAQAAGQLTVEEQRLAQAMNQTTHEARGQSQVLSDLKSLATQYLGVWGAQSYLHKIIETGGQLEQQRLSLSAILGDVEKANTLFGQVKELAIKSPFGVVQIDQMTKQLAAYSFEYEELFDWTKRLGDISAATGTEVSRLALALGHVRSEGALSGYTLRQFAMANVPVLRMLSENLGISTKEVRERVKKKEISAEDVQDILKQLTDEGGMFYNAQETMSEALNAKYKNLRDAFDIMYGEIAEGGVGEALKEIAIILTQGAKEWERFGKDILMVAAAFGIGKAAIALYNTALGEGTAATLRSITAVQQKENANLRLARAAGLVTKAEYEQLISNERYSVSALKVALTTNKLTIEELQRAVALGKVNKTVAQAAVVAAGYDAALISNVRVLGMWRRGIFLLGEGFRAVKAAVKGFFASVWPLLALTAVFDLVNRASSRNDAAKEAAEGAAKATNKYQDLQAMTERLGNSQGKTNDQLESNIKAMKEALVAVGEYTDELKKQVDSVDSLAEKYNILHEAMKNVSEQASDRQSRKQALIEGGLSSGGGTAWNPLNWFRDNALQDAKDIDDYTKDLYLALDENDKVLREGFRKILKTRGEWQEKFATMSAKDIFMSLSPEQQNDVLYRGRWGDNMSKSMQKASEAVAYIMYGSRTADWKNVTGYSYVGAFNELIGHKEKLSKAFEDAFRIDYPEIDLSKADEDQKIIFAKWLDTTTANLADVKEAGKKALNDIIIEGTIKVRPQYSYDSDNWEDFLKEFEEKNPLAFYEWNKHANGGSLSIEEKRKSAESYKRTFGGSTANTIGNDAKKRLKELDEEEIRLINERNSAFYRESADERQRVENRLAEIKIQRERLKQAQKDTNQYGDPDKGGKKSEDKDARRLREIVKLYKDAYDWYGKYEKQVGEGSALAKVKEQFEPLFKQFEEQFKQKLSLDSIPLYKKNLVSLLDEAQKLYESPKHKNSYMVEAIKTIRDAINNVDYEEAQRKMDEYASKVQTELDGLTRAWDMFNNVREATGNIDLAVQLSGADYQAGQTRNLADALRQKIEKDFASANAVAIPFDVNMSDKDIENNIKVAIPKESEERIKGIVEEYKKWRDLQREVLANDIDTFAKLLGSAVDLQSQVQKINAEYDKMIESLDRLKMEGRLNNAKYNGGLGVAQANRDMKLVQATKEYQFLMDGIVTMSKKAARDVKQNFTDALKKQLLAGAITAKEYADKISDINKKMKELENAPSNARAFIQGGLNGLYENMQKKGRDMQEHGAQMMQDAKKMIDSSFTNGGGFDKFTKGVRQMNAGKEMMQIGAGMEQMGGEMIGTVAIIDMVVHGINDLVQGLKGAFDEIREMYDALGHDTKTDNWENWNTFFSSFSDASNSATKGWDSLKNGNVGGVIEGVVGSFTGLITGFAKGHDKKRQNHIEAIERNIAALEANTAVIRNMRNRTLGYDTGDLRQSFAQKYRNDSAADDAMRVFYQSNGNGSGYAQELANLEKMRQNYIGMYNEEEDKKKSSEETLLQYKQKIAELDEQIMYFAEDLAKELWDIDLKGWADQIGDALWTAFENGEDALKAFKNTAKEIIADVAKRMMTLNLIEPAMAKLQEALFGKIGPDGKHTGGGAYNMDTHQFDEKRTLEILGNFFGEDGEFAKVIKSAESFYNMTERVTGVNFSSDENGSSSSIKSITEQTADLLASYVNAIRADVSVNRAMIAQYFPMYYQALTSGNASLKGIENHTAAIMQSNEAIAKSNQEILDMIDGLRNNTWKVPMA